MRIKKLYFCKECGEFKSKKEVREVKEGIVDYHVCKACGDVVYTMKTAIEQLLINLLD